MGEGNVLFAAAGVVGTELELADFFLFESCVVYMIEMNNPDMITTCVLTWSTVYAAHICRFETVTNELSGCLQIEWMDPGNENPALRYNG